MKRQAQKASGSIVLSIAIFAGAMFSHAASGDLDRTFSGDGKLMDLVPGTTDMNYFVATAVQPDGGIVAVGNVFNQPRFVYVARYKEDGSLDASFGGGTGKVALQFGQFYNYATDVALQPDGKILISGCYCEEDLGDYTLALARLNSDGSLDGTFGVAGRVLRPDIVGPANSIAIQSDGKIVVAGQSGFYLDWLVIRFNPDGTQDTGFNVLSNIFAPGHAWPLAAAVQDDGKIVVAGSDRYTGAGTFRFSVVRYNPNGSLDTSFDGDGIVTTEIGTWAVARSVGIQSDGKIVAAGGSNIISNNVFAVARYNADGSLDTTFDTDGIATTQVQVGSGAQAVAIQPDGKIVGSGSSHDGNDTDFGFARYLPNGDLDTTFGGGDGIATIDFSNGDDSPYGMALDPAGRAVLVGNSDNKFAVARILLSNDLKRNGKIAFTSDRDGNREIYVMDPDGSNQTRITNNTIIDDFATWSPDGRKIAFLSQRTSGVFAIFTMNADGSNRVEVTAVNYVPRTPWNGIDFRHMSWSPDGSRIAFTDMISTVATLLVVNADGSNRRSLTTGLYPAWSPDGSKILFLRPTQSVPIYNLYTIGPDGNGLQFIPTLFPFKFYSLFDSPPLWSPDGLKILISATDFANSELYIANADGTSPQIFAHICGYSASVRAPVGCGFNTAYPAWSPDAESIAFATWDWSTSSTEIFAKNIGDDDVVQLTATAGSNSHPNWQSLATKATPFDYDGDGKTDFSVWRRTGGDAVGMWYIAESSTGAVRTSEWDPDLLAPADYDGDGSTDIAAAQQTWPGTNELITWHIDNSSTGSGWYQVWGFVSDKRRPADYDGDGKADLAVWRPTDGTWHIAQSSNDEIRVQQWGLPGDKPTPADFDGDGKAELAVFRPTEGRWYVRSLANGSITIVDWGLPGDIPVVGDYSGDGKADYAVYRPSNNTWYRQHTNDGTFNVSQWGLPGDFPVPGDFDGDGKTDVAVWRPSDGTWYVLKSTSGIFTQSFGTSGDIPTPNAFVY